MRRILLLAALCAMPMLAGSVSVSPVRVELSRQKPTSLITLENRGIATEYYQIEGTDWSQENGTDRYQRSGDLIVVPPVFKLEPGKTQIVRIGLKRMANRRETAYRIFIREMPAPEAVPVPNGGIRTLLRISVPIFFDSGLGERDKPALNWLPVTEGGRITDFQIENVSSVHVQVGNVQLGDGGQLPVGLYILPGQTKRWMLPESIPLTGRPLSVRAETDQGVLTAEAVPAGR